MATPKTLASPTDFGNTPGSGPLRVGGRDLPSDALSKSENNPSTRTKASQVQMAAVEIERDLWGGNMAVKAQTTKYLPRAPGEETDDYQNRLDRSVFLNFFRRTVEGLTGLIFRKDPVLSEEVPDVIREHWENIDLEGTHGDTFLWELETDAISVGHAAIFVEYPDTGGEQGREQEESQEIRPYWIPIKKENILSWRMENIGGVNTLVQVVLQETMMVPHGAFGEKEATQYRVLYRLPDGVVGWQLFSMGADNKVIPGNEGTYPTQTEIPIAEVKTSGSISMFVSDPPLLDMSFINIAYYQQWSDYAWSIHKTCVPFIFIAGIPEAKNPDGTPAGPLIIGANTAIRSSAPDGKAEYVSHDGAALDAAKDSLDDLKSDMSTLGGLAMLAPQKRAAETAEAKRLDKSTSDSSLAVTARALQDGVENALQFHANYLKRPGQADLQGGSVQINRDFEGTIMDPSVMAAIAALVREGFPSSQALKMLQAGGRIEEDADLDVLEVLWEMGKASTAQMPGPSFEG